MRITTLLLALPLCAVLTRAQDLGPKNELAFSLGGIPSLSRGNGQQTLDAGAGTAFAANYGRRIFGGAGKFALFGEINFLASPSRGVSSNIPSATKEFASLYVTPGVRLKFFPRSAISPYVLVGGGYGDYEQSTTTLNGQPNPAPRQIGRGVFDFGGGADVRAWRFIALRGEVRDFYTGAPIYNIAGISGGQHNVAVTGGFVVRWH